MASSVFYKFKSQRDESRVNFDGTGISVFDLKKEIILANNLGKANDFDLVVLDPSSNEGAPAGRWIPYFWLIAPVEYKDDTHVIPRSSSVVVKRVFAKPGKGKAAMYIASASTSSSSATSDPSKATQGGSGSYAWHRGNISRRFDGKEEPSPSASRPAASAPVSVGVNQSWYATGLSELIQVIKPSTITKDDEAAAMAAMFQAQTANWEETQEKMSQLVSRLAILVLCSIYALMSTCFLFYLSAITEPSAYIPIREAGDPVVAGSRSSTTTSIVPFHRAMSATGADRKVCSIRNACLKCLMFSDRSLDPRLSDE